MEHAFAKDRLMESLSCHSSGIDLLGTGKRGEIQANVTPRESQNELMSHRVFACDVDREFRLVDTPLNSDEVGQRQRELHSSAKRSIRCEVAIGALVLVPGISVFSIASS